MKRRTFLSHSAGAAATASLFAAPGSSNSGRSAEPGGLGALWGGAGEPPSAAEIPLLPNVRITTIKKREPALDGYDWLHGVALAFHEGTLFASWGHNMGLENTRGEVAQASRSFDAGRTWTAPEMMAPGGRDYSVSHGVFLSHGGNLWAFMGSFREQRVDTKTRAYVLNDSVGRWMPQGPVVEDEFWPMAEPRRMDDGNWIMSGISVSGTYPAAVAISHGDDLTQWDVVRVPNPGVGKMWGESAVIVDGPEVLNISRYGAKSIALASVSQDYGRSWENMRESNMPMAGSKPYAGILSTGQRYLICTTAAGSGHNRWPLTIAVGRPGERAFRKVFGIRDGILPDEENTTNAKLAYPYAVEQDALLYVGYSSGRLPANRNSAELAVLPVRDLAI